jgi:hypothetical protein
VDGRLQDYGPFVDPPPRGGAGEEVMMHEILPPGYEQVSPSPFARARARLVLARARSHT